MVQVSLFSFQRLKNTQNEHLVLFSLIFFFNSTELKVMLCILVAYEMWSQPKVRLHDGEGELNKGGKFAVSVGSVTR